MACLLGPNGAGKTTALSTAAGLLAADDGTVQFAGQPVAPNAPPRLMGYLPQQSSFPPVLTAREVVDFSFSARRTPASSRQEILSLTGVERVLDETVGTLSSGWIRRLGLAVALAPPSGLLLLDEPFVGLDLDILDSIVAHLKNPRARDATMRNVLLVARREWKLLHRSRSAQAAAVLVLAIAWLPPLLVSIRVARLGLAPFADVTPLTLAIAGVILPLLTLLAGADLLAGELEEGFLVPVVSLPISRRACYIGKFLGRACVMGAFYVLAFGSAGAAIGILHGPDGWQDYVVVAAGGFLLSLSCAGIGAALASISRSRVRAYATSLGFWVLLVFALDAGLLAATIGLAPPPPDNVGHHGHDELVAPRRFEGCDVR